MRKIIRIANPISMTLLTSNARPTVTNLKVLNLQRRPITAKFRGQSSRLWRELAGIYSCGLPNPTCWIRSEISCNSSSSCSFSYKNQHQNYTKKSFFNTIIHTYFRFTTSQKKTSCYRFSLYPPHLKMSQHYLQNARLFHLTEAMLHSFKR